MMQNCNKIISRYLRATRITFVCIANYSRKSGGSESDYGDIFKIVTKNRNHFKDTSASTLNPNWELLTPIGYKYFLPGNTGLALNETTNLDYQHFDLHSCDFDCKAQECPVLLRQNIIEQFPGQDLVNLKLTVVTLSQKISQNTTDLDKITKTFVLAAQQICGKLKFSGYWADFINPFSGLPFVKPLYYNGVPVVAQSQSKVHFQGLKITEKRNCRIIKKKSPTHFIGTLYTDAPANIEVLRQIILQDNIVSHDTSEYDDLDDDHFVG